MAEGSGMSGGFGPGTLIVAAAAFIAGYGFASFTASKRRNDKENAGATVEGNDLSLFYTKDEAELKSIRSTSKTQKFLPSKLYGEIVREVVVCCVDCLIVRVNAETDEKECLLVERASEPVKGVWWLPGGRMYKGETFFEAAERKAREETGLDGAKALQVLGFYNTFFPTSHWDTDTHKGTQTAQPIILVELEKGSEVNLDSTSERFKWIGLDPDEAERAGEDRYVLEALRRLHAWQETYGA